MTPRLAFAFLRASLMTLVSIKYIRCLGRRLDALEVLVPTHVRHRSQHFREAALARARQCRREDRPMFSLGASAVRAGTLLERPDNRFIDATNQQVGHTVLPMVAR